MNRAITGKSFVAAEFTLQASYDIRCTCRASSTTTVIEEDGSWCGCGRPDESGLRRICRGLENSPAT
ncbi:MAG: hypothetical protein JW795_11155 [Chitinivibrionales bacterium]|nr:hypothetical protein [Chitinivibrionales bacterium]